MKAMKLPEMPGSAVKMAEVLERGVSSLVRRVFVIENSSTGRKSQCSRPVLVLRFESDYALHGSVTSRQKTAEIPIVHGNLQLKQATSNQKLHLTDDTLSGLQVEREQKPEHLQMGTLNGFRDNGEEQHLLSTDTMNGFQDERERQQRDIDPMNGCLDDREHQQLGIDSINGFQDGKEERKQQVQIRRRTKKNSQALQERIAHEMLRKRDSDRESTPTVRALTWACRLVDKPADVDSLVAGLDLALPIFTSTIQKLGMEKKPRAAMAVFNWLQSTSDKTPNVYTYNSLLGALKSNAWYEAAEAVFVEMQQRNIAPDIVTYNTLISLYEQQRKFGNALRIFRRLKSLGLKPTLFTFRNIVQILGKNGDLECALDVFGELRKAEEGREKGGSKVVELKRNPEQRQELEKIVRRMFCDRVLLVISQNANREECIRLFNKAKSVRLQLDRNSYEKLILACGQSEADHKLVKLLYLEMRKQQLPISVSLCNHVIIALGRAKQWWGALEVYEHMVQVGPQPNSYTHKVVLSHFQVLLNSARERRIWKWAVQLLDKMIEKGVEPDRFAWNAALIACAKAGETGAAVLVFQRMIERGQRPGIVSYGALLSALEKSNSLSGAKLVWEHMQKMGVRPNDVAYTTMISACGRGGNYGEARRLVEEMRGAGIMPSLITYNALITACARAGDGERALDLIEQMKAAKVQPDAVTYAQLIEAMANAGMWESAITYYGQMLDLNLRPPAYAFEAVIRVCKANNIPIDSRVLDLRPSS